MEVIRLYLTIFQDRCVAKIEAFYLANLDCPCTEELNCKAFTPKGMEMVPSGSRLGGGIVIILQIPA